MCLVQSMCPHVVFYVWQGLPGLLVKQQVFAALVAAVLRDTVYKL